MIKEKECDVLYAAVKKFGKMAQLSMLLEEMSELQKEVLKNINRNKDNVDEIIDEVADVEIQLEQLKYIYDIKQQVEDRIPRKVEKLKSIMEK